MTTYIGLIGGSSSGGKRPTTLDRHSTLSVSEGNLRVIGNLPHCYAFQPRTIQDAQTLIDYLNAWIAKKEAIQELK
jgi:hypothetical protein